MAALKKCDSSVKSRYGRRGAARMFPPPASRHKWAQRGWVMIHVCTQMEDLLVKAKPEMLIFTGQGITAYRI